ncbi:unnamed protein product [Caenorhabditis bovis]|uniref:Uncharacterized protein n=1 Tax=Caenorhabditis bovis TaxID=2654633 RepID=A0A8S1EVN2_9PELO|nr:unnamed protein product [Caenorhabditis bovis]
MAEFGNFGHDDKASRLRVADFRNFDTMSDDLSAFFAKKKDKKKKAAVKIEEVGQALERRARIQEDFEPEAIDDSLDKRGDDEKTSNTEDSEWIEYGDSNQGRLEGLKIKDMGLENESEEVGINEQEDRESHETKTWGQVNSERKAAEEPEHAETISDKQMAAAYKPPAFRKYQAPHQQKQAPVNFDMNSDALFPSLADASKIEKTKKDDAKTSAGWTKAGQSENRAPSKPYNVTTGTGRESALAAVKNLMSTNNTPIVRQPPPQAAEVPEAKPVEKKNVYVPPSLRNRQ